MNRVKISNLYLGILLIAAGAILLAVNIGFEPDLDDSMVAVLLAVGSGLILVGYVIGDLQRWWLLLPAAALAAGALAIILENRETADNFIGGLSAVIISIPFWSAFLVDRSKNRWALIPGPLLTFTGFLLAFVADGSGLFASLILLAVAALFFGVFLFNRKQRWSLIPAYVLLAVALVILLEARVPDELFAAVILWAIALPFLVVFLINRENWWALIPAYALIIIGLITMIASGGDDELIGSIVLFTIAIPFFFVFFNNRENWWALIPAGVLTSIGLAISFVFLDLTDEAFERLISGIILGGIAVTFGVIWAQRKRTNGEWAKYPAAACALASLLVLILGMRLELLWGAALIGVGGWILLRNRPNING
jgi:hypothetical protein